MKEAGAVIRSVKDPNQMPTENQTDVSYECPGGKTYQTLPVYLTHLATRHPEEI